MSKLTPKYVSAGDRDQGVNWLSELSDNLDRSSDLSES